MEKILFSIGKTLYFHPQALDFSRKSKKTRFAPSGSLARSLRTGKIASLIFSKVT
jgi:hypothetical protein